MVAFTVMVTDEDTGHRGYHTCTVLPSSDGSLSFGLFRTSLLSKV